MTGSGDNSASNSMILKVGELSTNSAAAEIKCMLRELALAIVTGALLPDCKQAALAALGQNTGLDQAALSEDVDVMVRILRMSSAEAPELQLAVATLERIFDGGCSLWGDPDGVLFAYDGRRWRRVLKEQIVQAVTDTCLALSEFSQFFSAKIVNSAVKSILLAIGRKQSILRFENQSVGPSINAQNGELWRMPDGFILRPHRPWSRQFETCDADYLPEATCPLYDGALKEIFEGAASPSDMARHWNEFFGYVLQPTRKVASFWLLYGNGANGKSRLLDLLQKLVGYDAVLAEPISRFQQDSFALSSLHQKKALIDDDVDEDLVLSDGLIKKLSEEKTFTARAPYGRGKMTIKSLAVPIMAGNHFPSTRDVSHGMRRRTFVIPFLRTFVQEEQKPGLFETIWTEERSGVLNRALGGFLALEARNFEFLEPNECIQFRERFFEESHPLRQFLAERCFVTPGQKVRLTTLREAFQEWSKTNGIRQTGFAGNKLGRSLELLGYSVTKIKGYPFAAGLSLKAMHGDG